MRLGQVTVFTPSHSQSPAYYSQMDRQHQLAVVRNVNKKGECITTHSHGSTVRLKSTTWTKPDQQAICVSAEGASKISTCVFLQRVEMYRRTYDASLNAMLIRIHSLLKILEFVHCGVMHKVDGVNKRYLYSVELVDIMELL